MDAPAAPSSPSPSPPSRGAETAPPGEPLFASVKSLLHELPGLIGDRVELLSLELERAGRALAQIAMLIVASAVLAVTAWLALWLGVGLLLIELGLSSATVLLGLVVVHGIAIAVALHRARRLARLLSLPATRRHLAIGISRRDDGATPPAAPHQPQGAAQAGHAVH